MAAQGIRTGNDELLVLVPGDENRTPDTAEAGQRHADEADRAREVMPAGRDLAWTQDRRGRDERHVDREGGAKAWGAGGFRH
jgi:hypothetical protein